MELRFSGKSKADFCYLCLVLTFIFYIGPLGVDVDESAERGAVLVVGRGLVGVNF